MPLGQVFFYNGYFLKTCIDCGYEVKKAFFFQLGQFFFTCVSANPTDPKVFFCHFLTSTIQNMSPVENS